MLEGYMDSGIGAAIGFALAQLINVARAIREWYTRPKLVIESCHENSVLETTEYHTVYGFSIRNAGRSIATGVRVQLLEIVARHEGDKHYLSCLSMKVRSPMPCSCSCLSPTRSQRRRRELHGADSDMAQRLETAMAHTLRLGSLAELHG